MFQVFHQQPTGLSSSLGRSSSKASIMSPDDDSHETNHSDGMALDEINHSNETDRSKEITHLSESIHTDEIDRSDDIAPNLSAKRDADSLFVSQDENVAEVDEINAKRLKRDHGEPALSSSPSPVVIDGKVVPYDAFAIEHRPRLAIYHPGFKKTELQVHEVCQTFEKNYNEAKENGYENADMDNILRSLRKWNDPPRCYPCVRPVAFLGPAGVGKSSGISCYLSQAGVARTNDWGARGTNVVHEYWSAQYDQTSKFVVVVKYFPSASIAMRVESHCYAIMDYMHSTEPNDDEIDREEAVQKKEKHDAALSFFHTLLCDHEEFQTKHQLSALFESHKGFHIKGMIAEFQEYIHGLLDEEKIRQRGNQEVFAAENETELNFIFKKISGSSVIADESQRKASIWPLISKVQIHQDLDLLNADVVLGDTPGISDTNQAVVENTISYLKNAGTILVFTTPGRATTDPKLNESLRLCIALEKMDSAVVIVTNIDDKSVLKDADKADLNPDDRDELEAAENKVEKLEQQATQLQKAKDSAESLAEYREIDKQIAQIGPKTKAAMQYIKQVTIEIRNRIILKDLKNRLRDLTGSDKAPDLPVIFTSNTAYEDHLKGYDVNSPPMLDVEATGIPAVRRMLYEVPAKGKMATLTRFVRGRLPHIFNGIIGILTKSPLERKQEVQDLIDMVLDQEVSLVSRMMNEIEKQFKKHIPACFDGNEPKWRQAALSKLQVWQQYNAGTFGAFCRRYGVWKYEKKPLNWNTEIQGIFADKLNSAFNSFEDEVEIIGREVIDNVNDLYSTLQKKLEACDAFQGVDEKPFFAQINRTQSNVAAEICTLFARFKQRLGMIRTAATVNTNIQNDCYTAIAMQDTYFIAKNKDSHSEAPPVPIFKKGKITQKRGALAARVQEIRKKLTGDEVSSVFFDVSQMVTDGFDDLMSEWGSNCRKKVADGSTLVKRDFDHRFETDEVKTEENEELVEMLLSAAHEAKSMVEGEMAEELAKCEAYERSGHY